MGIIFLFLFCGQVHIYYQGETMDKTIERILDKLPHAVQTFCVENYERNITEIRIRHGFDVKVAVNGQYIVIENSIADKSFIEDLFYFFCDDTVSAFEDQTSQGYITLPGGHRVGISGKFNTDLYGKTVVSEILSLNIRLAGFHPVHINKKVLDFNKGLLIAGSTHTGKTNFIKNICKLLSNKNIVICDERNELYSPFLDCDFIINQPKHIAVMQALRTMNPDYIICDEIGSDNETTALLNSLNSGVAFVCSVHADNMQSLKNKPNINVLLNYDVFDKIVFLARNENNFYIKEVYDL
ncbi:MAG: hypothetical protein E7492_03325 [Ruminococcaceae bacterium]|nr:hypothetical protein [Oscillospiraceae bacterium]